jgi:hypothetical protein
MLEIEVGVPTRVQYNFLNSVGFGTDFRPEVNNAMVLYSRPNHIKVESFQVWRWSPQKVSVCIVEGNHRNYECTIGHVSADEQIHVEIHFVGQQPGEVDHVATFSATYLGRDGLEKDYSISYTFHQLITGETIHKPHPQKERIEEGIIEPERSGKAGCSGSTLGFLPFWDWAYPPKNWMVLSNYFIE